MEEGAERRKRTDLEHVSFVQQQHPRHDYYCSVHVCCTKKSIGVLTFPSPQQVMVAGESTGVEWTRHVQIFHDPPQ